MRSNEIVKSNTDFQPHQLYQRGLHSWIPIIPGYNVILMDYFYVPFATAIIIKKGIPPATLGSGCRILCKNWSNRDLPHQQRAKNDETKVLYLTQTWVLVRSQTTLACLYEPQILYLNTCFYVKYVLRYVRLHSVRHLDSTGRPTVVNYQNIVWQCVADSIQKQRHEESNGTARRNGKNSQGKNNLVCSRGSFKSCRLSFSSIELSSKRNFHSALKALFLIQGLHIHYFSKTCFRLSSKSNLSLSWVSIYFKRTSTLEEINAIASIYKY